MNLYLDAFGTDFTPWEEDAALKLCLHLMFSDRDLKSLADFLGDVSQSRAIGGDPGWDLAFRKPGDNDVEYENWNSPKPYRAFVDPDGYPLDFPQKYYSRSELLGFVDALLTAYLERHPGENSDARRIREIITGGDFPQKLLGGGGG